MRQTRPNLKRGDVVAGTVVGPPGPRAVQLEVADALEESALGWTWRVKHLETGRVVRLTVFRDRVAHGGNRAEVEEAFRVARSIQHPQVARAGELGERDDGSFFYTWEDPEGDTLRALLAESRIAGRPLDPREAYRIAGWILEGLEASRQAGTVVRALRPETILVQRGRAGEPTSGCKLTGVGLWGLVPPAALAEDEFSRGETHYLAPELTAFEPTATARSDVFSAGVVLVEMLLGTAPSGSVHLSRTRRPDLPAHLDAVVGRALARSADDRYPSASAFAADLARVFTEEGGSGQPRRWARWAGRAAALLVLLLTAAAIRALLPDPGAARVAEDARLRAQVLAAQPAPAPAGPPAALPENMAAVPGGPFVRGRLHAESPPEAPEAEPLADVEVVPGFLVDLYEFPNRPGEAPRYGVSNEEAERLCAAAGKRLCTDAEWEKACKGPANLVYAYGDVHDPAACGEGPEDIRVSGARAACRSGWGAWDMSGNFREWTSSPAGDDPSRRVVKGGVLGLPQGGTRCARGTAEPADLRDPSLSFRCCLTLEPGASPGPTTPDAASGSP